VNQTPGRLMSVRTDLVREHLVGQLSAAAADRFPGELPDGLAVQIEAALEAVLGLERAATAPPETAELAATLARVGYLTRVIERELFEPARRRASWLGDMLRARLAAEESAWEPAAAALSRELAQAEPNKRADPSGEYASWRVPGPGGHVRHYVALEAAAERCPKDPEGNPRLPERIYSAGELKRCWLYGFLLRCCEEVRLTTPR
jgi:hypothetical protein